MHNAHMTRQLPAAEPLLRLPRRRGRAAAAAAAHRATPHATAAAGGSRGATGWQTKVQVPAAASAAGSHLAASAAAASGDVGGGCQMRTGGAPPALCSDDRVLLPRMEAGRRSIRRMGEMTNRGQNSKVVSCRCVAKRVFQSAYFRGRTTRLASGRQHVWPRQANSTLGANRPRPRPTKLWNLCIPCSAAPSPAAPPSSRPFSRPFA